MPVVWSWVVVLLFWFLLLAVPGVVWEVFGLHHSWIAAIRQSSLLAALSIAGSAALYWLYRVTKWSWIP
jgi:hypothetical protein